MTRKEKIKNLLSKNKSKILLAGSFVSLLVIFFFTFQYARADIDIEHYFAEGLFWIANSFLRIEGGIMQTLMAGFTEFVQYKGYFDEDFVQTGWGVVRDLVNLSFILVLMIIALMSILRVEESIVRHLLPRFVFAVLLVNFSFFFVRVVVGLADQLSGGFLNGVSGLGSAVFNYVNTYKFLEINSTKDINIMWATVTSAWLAVIFLAMVAVAIAVVAACMLVRIVAICVLTVLSPFAFLALILPSTAGLASKWMKNLFSYAFWGPAAVFFVWLSVITFVSKASPISQALNLTSGGAAGPATNGTAGQLLKFIVVSIFLYMAVIAGKLLGNTGADLGMKALGGAAKLGGKVLGEGLAAVTGSRGVGKEFGKAWHDFTSRNTKMRGEMMGEALRTGNIGTAYRAAVGRGKKGEEGSLGAQRARKEAAKREAEHASNYEKMSGSEMQDSWAKLQGKTDSESMEKKRALLRVAAKNGDLSKFLGDGSHLPESTDIDGNVQGISGALERAGFKSDESTKMTQNLASISDKSDKGDKRYAGLLGTQDGKPKVNDRNEYISAISDQVDDRIEKGEGKKISDKMFSNDEAGIAAIAGLKGGIGANGQPLTVGQTLKAKSWNKIRQSSQSGGYHAEVADQIRTQLAASPSASEVRISTLAEDGVTRKTMTLQREQAERYQRVIDEAQGVRAPRDMSGPSRPATREYASDFGSNSVREATPPVVADGTYGADFS